MRAFCVDFWQLRAATKKLDKRTCNANKQQALRFACLHWRRLQIETRRATSNARTRLVAQAWLTCAAGLARCVRVGRKKGTRAQQSAYKSARLLRNNERDLIRRALALEISAQFRVEMRAYKNYMKTNNKAQSLPICAQQAANLRRNKKRN